LYEFNKLNIKMPFLGGNPVLVWVENEELVNQGGAYDNKFTINGVLLLIKTTKGGGVLQFVEVFKS
jgi:hypothetical protein